MAFHSSFTKTVSHDTGRPRLGQDVINLTSGSTVLLKKILASNGMRYPKDSDMLTVRVTPQRFTAVKAGGVASAMVTPPTSFMAIESGLNIIANIGTYLPDYMFTSVGGNTDWMKNNSDATVRFLKAIIRAHRFLLDPKNKEVSIDILTKYAKVKRKYADNSQYRDHYQGAGGCHQA